LIQEPNVIPKELKRDESGLGRIARIEHADQLIAKARTMAAACIADVDRGFADFSDDDCPECATRAECGLHVYEEALFDAAHNYEKAGLVLLAKRVRKLAGSCVMTGWSKFDKANATTEIQPIKTALPARRSLCTSSSSAEMRSGMKTTHDRGARRGDS